MAITKVTTDVITALAVTAPKLAANAVTTDKLADNAVTAAKIAAGALGDQVAGITSSASATTIAGTLTSTGTITGTLATAAQTAITSVGTLTALTVDDITINGQSISTSASNKDIILVPHGTGDVEIQSDSLLVSATEGESASIVLRADESDDAGDDWAFTSNTGNTLTIGNDIASAGTSVAQMTLTPHATVASSTTAIAGNLTTGGAITSLTNFNSTSGNDLRLNAGSANRDIFMQVNGTTHMTVQGSTGKVLIGTAEAATIGKAIVMAMVFG